MPRISRRGLALPERVVAALERALAAGTVAGDRPSCSPPSLVAL
jgi:hypothetical protein